MSLPVDMIPAKKMVEEVFWNVMGEGAKHLLPPTIPEEFSDTSNPWHVFTAQVFYAGKTDSDVLLSKDGLSDKDRRRVFIWFRACLQSFEIQHEDKMAACAYILSMFF